MLRRLLYASDWEVRSFLHERGALSPARAFSDSPAGRREFGDFLAHSNSVPTYLLVDLTEENHQQEVMPHVSGKLRRAMTERRLAQLYADTPFRRAQLAGREAQGRRDDRILFSALTNPAAAGGWLRVLQQRRVPLVGMYSLALLSAVLRAELRLPDSELLLITHQSSGIRQSYFKNGHLTFSRIAPWYDTGPEGFATAVMRDAEKTREFLETSRLLARGERLQVVVLSSYLHLRALQPLCAADARKYDREHDVDYSTRISYRLMDIAEAAQRLGLGPSVELQVCDSLFLALLARKRPPRHYNTFEQNRVYALMRWRSALHLLSSATVTVCLAWTAINAKAGWDHYRQIQTINAEIATATDDYNMLMARMPKTAVSAQDMKAAVEIGRAIRQNVADIEPAMNRISQALAAVPGISVDRLNWALREPAGAPSPGLAPGGDPSVRTVTAASFGVPRKPGQVIVIEGEVLPFKGDYRRALDDVGRLAELLGRDRQQQVTVTRLPVDTAPQAKLDGQAGGTARDARALFALELVWRP